MATKNNDETGYSGTIVRDTPLKKILKTDYVCKKCGHCCKYSSGFLAPGDEQKIADFLELGVDVLRKVYLEKLTKFNTTLYRPKLLKEAHMPFGRCVFLKGNLCSIHDVRPLHCRVANYGELGDEISEWFHLNYFVNVNDPQSLREWNEHLEGRDGKTIPGGQIKDLVKNAKKRKQVIEYDDLEYNADKVAKVFKPIKTGKKKATSKKVLSKKKVKKTNKK